MNFQCAIFDMDGTLTDSMWIWEEVVYRFLDRQGIAAPPELGELFKNMTFEASSLYLTNRFPQLGLSPEEIRAIWQDMVFDAYARELTLKSGAYEYIKALKENKVKLVLLTSNFRKNAEAFLKQHQLSFWFDACFTCDEIGFFKDTPQVFLTVAAKMGISVEHCMVFEDLLMAVKSAKQAGMMVTAVQDAASLSEQEEIKQIADRYIVDYQEC